MTAIVFLLMMLVLGSKIVVVYNNRDFIDTDKIPLSLRPKF